MITPNNQHAKRPVGRPPTPTKLTKETTDRLCELISAGLCLRQACRLADIAPSTVYAWLNAGKDGTVQQFAEFFERIKKAQAVCELFWLEQLKKRRNWTKWAWLLERSFPDRWRPRDPMPRRKPPAPPRSGDDVMAEIEAVLRESRNGSSQTH